MTPTTKRDARMEFTAAEIHRLQSLRARYDQNREFFCSDEVARLWFSRWMWITRRMES